MSTHDLIARLRKLCPPNGEWINLAQYACKEAADALETLQRERDEAVAKLEARAGEAVAWAVTWPGDENETWHSVFINERDALHSASHHDGAQVAPLYIHPPTGDAAGKDSVDAALYTMDQMREYADNFHLSRMRVLVAEKEAYERHAPTEPTLDQIRKIEDDFGIVWFVPDDSETFAWRTTNTDEHRKFARAVWKAAIASLTKTADGEKT